MAQVIKKIKFIEFCKTFIVKRKLITIVQSNIDDKKYLKEDIIKELRKNFASYEIPDEIYITKKSLKSTYKKLALEDLLETRN